jgi:hypothetical protein
MTTPLDSLFRALGRASVPPADLAAAVHALPAVGELLSPWETWTLFGLVRHRQRQLWVGEVVTTLLGGSLLEIGRMGAFGHPPVPQIGPLPGQPEWEYYFHGKGCRVTHRVTREVIDVDFFSDSAEYFDLFFYERHLKSLRAPEPTERRLLDLHASIRPVRLAADDLLAAGALIPLPGREAYHFRVADSVLEHEADISAFCAAWADPARRSWLAPLVGDWPAAHEGAQRAGDPALTELTAGRAARCRELRRQRLLLARQDKGLTSEALLGLADVGAEELAQALGEALAGPPCGTTSMALEIIGRLDDPAWCPAVDRLFRRVEPRGPAPLPHVWMTSLKFLLRHGHRKEEVLAALPRAAGYQLGEACLLALEHAPELTLPLVRRALLSGVPANRTAVAAILALIDRPWSRRELLAALAASDDQERTADGRAALLECHDEEAHRAVRAWEERNPHEPEAGTFVKIGDREFGPCFSFGELALHDRPVRLRYEMEKLHDRVMRVRDRVPSEPPRSAPPWWKFWGKPFAG